MRLPVASFFLAIAITVPAANGAAQNTQRRSAKQRTRDAVASGTAKTGTLKICQGVSIPAGYVIIGYMTSSSCPHGAYVLKKERPESQGPAWANQNESIATDNPATENSVTRNPVIRNSASEKSVAASPRAQQSPGTSSSVSRPRRVGSGAPESNAVASHGVAPRTVATDPPESSAPVLHGVAPRPEPGPPTLAGINSTGTPVNANAPTEPVAEPGPEEVSEGDVVRVETSLVTVPVSVLDRQGRFVPNLRREDFKVFDNDVEQTIAYFEPAEKPFTVALLLDTSASTHFHLWQIKEAAINFAKQLRPQDRVLVVTFNDQVLLLTESTNDLNVISAVITEHANTGDSTRLYDAVNLVIKERLDQIKGRKAIVLFTDGVDTSSYLATYQSTLREVEELDALIYPIKYDTSDYLRAMQGLGSVTVVTTTSNWPFPGRTSTQVINPTQTTGGPSLPGTTKADYDRADQYLNELATKTGGRVHKANDPAQLSQAFSMIAEELRRQYTLGYYPGVSADQNGERRQIRVRVRKPNLGVKARDSYIRSSAK
jgi:VWFA-related protein